MVIGELLVKVRTGKKVSRVVHENKACISPFLDKAPTICGYRVVAKVAPCFFIFTMSGLTSNRPLLIHTFESKASVIVCAFNQLRNLNKYASIWRMYAPQSTETLVAGSSKSPGPDRQMKCPCVG